MTQAQWTDRFVTGHGIKIHVIDWGSEGQFPMLLIHGFSQTAHTWDEFAPTMRDRYHVYAMDQRGHGDSDWAPDGAYQAVDFVADIAGVVKSLGIQRMILCGMSLGGRNSIMFTAMYPNVVERLVLVDVGPEMIEAGTKNIRNFVASVPAEFDSIDAAIDYAATFNPRRSRDNLYHRLYHNLKPLPSGEYTWKYDPVFRTQEWSESREAIDLWSYFRRITCPTLIVRGAQSDVFAAETGKTMVEVHPNCRMLEVEGAGHSVMGDNPAGFRAAVGGFLAART
jgi:esterase